MNLEQLVRENIKKLIPYSSAREEAESSGKIQLDANENPFVSDYNRYPDPYQKELKEVVSTLKNASSKNLIIGNGSDELIDLVIRSFCNPGKDNIVTIKPSYGMYKVSTAINDVELIEVALNTDFTLDGQRVLDACNKNTKIIILCSPNNPTGNLLNEKEISKIMNDFAGLVLIDEAYIDFADTESWIKSLDKYPQLFVIQTLSKSFGLAGLRLGLGWGSTELITVLNKVKPPYNINEASQNQAILKLKNRAEYKSQLANIKKQKVWLESNLDRLEVIQDRYPSDANFILIKVLNANSVYDYLIENSVVVRNRTNQYGCENCLRISVGLEKENKKLIELLKNYK